MSSLKNRRSSQTLIERLERVREVALSEDLDRDTMNKAIETVKRLNSINLTAVPALDQARDEAVASVSDAAAGVDGRSLGQKAIDLFRGQKSPLIDALTFASALRSFFTLLERYVDALTNKAGREAIDKNKTLNALMGDFADYNDVMTRQAGSLRNIVEKGFKPDGLFARQNNDWRKRFVKASNDDIVDQIMEMTPEQLSSVTKAVKTATGEVPKLASAAASSSAATTPSGEKQKPHNSPGVVDDMADVVRQKLGTTAANVKPDVIKRIIGILDDVYGINR